MTLVSCFVKDCNEKFVSIKALSVHRDLRHSDCLVFICRHEGCGRKFDKWNSFYKHLIAGHNLPTQFEGFKQRSNQALEGRNLSESYQDANTLNQNMQPMDIDSFNEVQSSNETVCNDDSLFSYEALLKSNVDLIVAKWYRMPGMPRNVVDCLVKDLASFLSGGFVDYLQSHIGEILEKLSADENDQRDVQNMFDLMKKSFGHLSTEYKRLKYFRNSGYYVPPQTYIIQSRIERSKSGSDITLKMTDVTGQFIPLQSTLKSFFELPDAFHSTVEYVNKIENESTTISNFIQGQRWKELKAGFGKNDLVFPLHFHYDDFEPNNALGPHSEKIGAVYATVPCIPPECQSKLDNIFEVLLFNADDRKLYGNGRVFRPLIDELVILKTRGVTVDLPDGPRTIYFVCGLLLGDNLGLHGMCGLVEGFTASFPCRFCKASKQMTEILTVEDPTLLRNASNYEADLATANFSLTGIKEKCVFIDDNYNDIKLFQGCDSMHDGAEGIYHYTMIEVLKHFHKLDGSFLEKLNNRSYVFDYGPVDKDNQPPSITPEMLAKTKLKMTAAEMNTFVRLFGVFVGDLVCENDEYWHLFLLLHKIDSFLQAKKLPCDAWQSFKVIVEEHHALYLRLTRGTLKPKHHYLIHYPSVFQMAGPFSLYSSMRYEANHKLQKSYSNVCNSRRNLVHSIAVKRQFAKCFRYLSKESILPQNSLGPSDVAYLSELNISKQELPDALRTQDEHLTFKWIEFKGTHYRQGMVLVIGVGDSRSLIFGKIECILLFDSEPIFVYSHLENYGYDAHVLGYRVEDENCTTNYSVSVQALLDPLPLYPFLNAKGKRYIVPRYFL